MIVLKSSKSKCKTTGRELLRRRENDGCSTLVLADDKTKNEKEKLASRLYVAFLL